MDTSMRRKQEPQSYLGSLHFDLWFPYPLGAARCMVGELALVLSIFQDESGKKNEPNEATPSTMALYSASFPFTKALVLGEPQICAPISDWKWPERIQPTLVQIVL